MNIDIGMMANGQALGAAAAIAVLRRALGKAEAARDERTCDGIYLALGVLGGVRDEARRYVAQECAPWFEATS